MIKAAPGKQYFYYRKLKENER